jgi:hypothetical protein
VNGTPTERRKIMAGISLNQGAATLRTDSLAGLGVTIKDINLECNTCGEDYMLPVPWDTGNFPRNWYVCPCGCNKGAAKKAAA